jgi:hypothetical protein
MRRLIILLSTLAIAACTFAADAQDGEGAPSGRGGTREFDVGAFEAVSVAGPYDVVVTVGPALAVRAEGDEAELDRMKVEVEDGALRVGRKREGWNQGWKRHSGKVTVYVSAPALRGASIAGSGNVKVDRVEGASFSGSIAGSGDLSIASLRVEEADFDVAGSGHINAVGAGRRARVSIAGSGNVNLEGFESRLAKVSIVGSGDVRTRTMETADVSIMGSGDVTVIGPARCSVTKMGSGNVHCEA